MLSNQNVLWSITLVSLSLCQFCSTSLAGLRTQPGAVVRNEVALDSQERSYAAERGNAAPANAIVSIAVPAGFEPKKSWPVLVVLSTSDFNRKNSDDISFYLQSAMAEKWIVLAGDAPVSPRADTLSWRFSTTLAAIKALYRTFPGAQQWPVACVGFSGGARRAGAIGPLLALYGCRISGLYLTGINDDRLAHSYEKFLSADRQFLNTPIFVSSGSQDEIATVRDQIGVVNSLKKTGFSTVRQEVFGGGHQVNRPHVQSALVWFRSMFTAVSKVR
jgi:hypothetical protein